VYQYVLVKINTQLASVQIPFLDYKLDSQLYKIVQDEVHLQTSTASDGSDMFSRGIA
jgi:hypothetical protein